MTKLRTLDYAPSPSQTRVARQVVGILLLVMAGMMAARFGAELDYRLDLFYRTYGAKPGLNHVDDYSFRMYYACNTEGALAAVAAACLLRRRWVKLLALGIAVVNLAIGLSYFAMHRTGALVEYSEWARVWGP